MVFVRGYDAGAWGAMPCGREGARQQALAELCPLVLSLSPSLVSFASTLFLLFFLSFGVWPYWTVAGER